MNYFLCGGKQLSPCAVNVTFWECTLWVLIMRNPNESLTSKMNFFLRSWNAYQQGFGTLDSLYWIGLDKLQRGCAVRFDLLADDGTWYYAQYSTFVVGGSADNYRLNIGGYEGNFGDAMTNVHNNMQFSTYDGGPLQDCGQLGGWWYVDGSCGTAWLTTNNVIEWIETETYTGYLVLNAVEVRFACWRTMHDINP